MDHFKISIKEIKNPYLLENPRFNVSYSPGINSSQPKRSYQIISALKGDAGLVLEINSSLFNLSSNQRGDPALSFLEEVRNLSWNYRYRKIAAAPTSNSLEQLFSFMRKPDNTAHQIFVEIPDEIWRDEKFIVPLIPVHGARYYLGGPEVDVLDTLFNGQYTDDQLLSSFKLICYDCSGFGQMGIYTREVTLSELQKTLGQ